jgi:hypothetical protein
MVPLYKDDFGNQYNNLNFKFEYSNKFSGNPNSLAGGGFVERTNTVSCSSTLFNMRKAKILWDDGSSTEIPIPRLEDVDIFMTELIAKSGVACVSLKGEHWANVPAPKLGKAFGDFASSAIAGAVKPPKQGVLFRYRLDGVGGNSGIIVKKSFYTLPAQIYTAQTDCIDALTNDFNCSPTEGLELRHFTGKRVTTGGGTIGRKVYVGIGTEATIKACGGDIIEFFNCVGYDGTSMANAELFY